MFLEAYIMIELLVLATLFFGPCHGYEIKKNFPGIKINNNTLYPLLQKLVKNGWVNMELQPQDNKPAKKVYHLTETGHDRLFELITDFDKNKAASIDEFFIRVAFFQFLPKDSIKQILDSRDAFLNDQVSQQKLMVILDRFPDKAYDILYMKKYASSKLFDEKQFVKTLKEKYGIEDEI